MLETLKNAFLYGKDFCEDTVENLRETVVTAVDSAKLHYRIVSNRNALNAMYAQLGRELLCGAGSGSEDKGEDAKKQEINKLCERIKGKEEVLSGLLDQYRIVCGKVICPECGRFMSETFAFCPYCGAHVSDTPDEQVSDIPEDDLLDIREISDI